MTDTSLATERPTLWGTLRALLRADFTVLLRNNRALVVSILLPVLILIITSLGKRQALGDPTFVICIAITFGLLSSGLLGYSLSLARDREAGVFQRLRVTPAPTWTIMTSRLAVQVLVSLLITLVVIIIGSIIHNVVFTVSQYLLLLAAAIVIGAVFLSLGQAMVGLLKSATTINAVGRLLFIALVLVGLLGTTGILGSSFQTFAEWTPVGAAIVLSYAVTDVSGWVGTDTNAIIACLGYIVIFAFIGIRWFRWEAR